MNIFLTNKSINSSSTDAMKLSIDKQYDERFHKFLLEFREIQ